MRCAFPTCLIWSFSIMDITCVDQGPSSLCGEPNSLKKRNNRKLMYSTLFSTLPSSMLSHLRVTPRNRPRRSTWCRLIALFMRHQHLVLRGFSRPYLSLRSMSTTTPTFPRSPVPTNPLGQGYYIRTAAALIIGDEILNGKTLDKNSNFFARYCFENGIELCSQKTNRSHSRRRK